MFPNNSTPARQQQEQSAPPAPAFHPCLRVFKVCEHGERCRFAQMPYEACLDFLKGTCRRENCKHLHPANYITMATVTTPLPRRPTSAPERRQEGIAVPPVTTPVPAAAGALRVYRDACAAFVVAPSSSIELFITQQLAATFDSTRQLLPGERPDTLGSSIIVLPLPLRGEHDIGGDAFPTFCALLHYLFSLGGTIPRSVQLILGLAKTGLTNANVIDLARAMARCSSGQLSQQPCVFVSGLDLQSNVQVSSPAAKALKSLAATNLLLTSVSLKGCSVNPATEGIIIQMCEKNLMAFNEKFSDRPKMTLVLPGSRVWLTPSKPGGIAFSSPRPPPQQQERQPLQHATPQRPQEVAFGAESHGNVGFSPKRKVERKVSFSGEGGGEGVENEQQKTRAHHAEGDTPPTGTTGTTSTLTTSGTNVNVATALPSSLNFSSLTFDSPKFRPFVAQQSQRRGSDGTDPELDATLSLNSMGPSSRSWEVAEDEFSRGKTPLLANMFQSMLWSAQGSSAFEMGNVMSVEMAMLRTAAIRSGCFEPDLWRGEHLQFFHTCIQKK